MSVVGGPVAPSALEVSCRRHALAPSVAVRVWLRGGLLAEKSPGLALATGRMLVEGTTTRSWDRIARHSEDLGMDVSGFAGSECSGVSIDALAGDWREAVDLAADLVNNSTFPAARCRWIRQQTVAELTSLGEQPEIATAWAFLERLYGVHPWGRPLQGSFDGLDRIDSSSCETFHRGALTRGVIVSVAGDIEEQEVHELVEARFGGLRHAETISLSVAPPPERGAEVREVELDAADQVQVFAGHLTVALGHEDFVALEVASVILGSGPGLAGRIPERLRERDGLAYAASADLVSGAGTQPGRLVIHAGTAVERVDELLVAVGEELERFIDDGPRADEFQEARSYLLGSDPFRRETARQLAALEAQEALFGLPFGDPAWLRDSLGALDRETVAAAVGRHLDPERLVVVLGLPKHAGRSRRA